MRITALFGQQWKLPDFWTLHWSHLYHISATRKHGNVANSMAWFLLSYSDLVFWHTNSNHGDRPLLVISFRQSRSNLMLSKHWPYSKSEFIWMDEGERTTAKFLCGVGQVRGGTRRPGCTSVGSYTDALDVSLIVWGIRRLSAELNDRYLHGFFPLKHGNVSRPWGRKSLHYAQCVGSINWEELTCKAL